MNAEQLVDEIEDSLNSIPFDSPDDMDLRASGRGLTGTCQFTLTGLGSWLVTYINGVHDCVRCDQPCDPPPDATFTCSPETYVAVLRRECGLNTETARLQGLLTITGAEALARAVLRDAS
jgi:hypothetical protein